MVGLLQHRIGGGVEDGVSPEGLLIVADELLLEGIARSNGADRQQEDRRQHGDRAFVRRMGAVAMPVVLMRVVVVPFIDLGLAEELVRAVADLDMAAAQADSMIMSLE